MFKKIIGNSKVKEILANQIKTNLVAQTYLFVGPEQVGKLSVAKIFARILICQKREVAPCNKCPACLQYKQATTPLLTIINKHTDKDCIGINEIRELIRQTSIKSPIDSTRFIIINDAQSLTESAGNSLLKLIEEPPANTHIIIITDSKNNLPDTIVSRCQMIRFRSVTIGDIEEYLKNNVKLSVNTRQEMALASLGSPGRLSPWIAEPATFEQHKIEVKSLIKVLSENNLSEIKLLIDLFDNEDKNNTYKLPGTILLHTIIRDLALLKHKQDKKVINRFALPSLKKLMLNKSVKEISFLYKRLYQLQRDLSYNINKNLALENFIIQTSI